MTEMVLDVLYYGFLVGIALAAALPTTAAYFLLKYVWKRGWIWNFFGRFGKWFGTTLQRGVSRWWSKRKKRIKWLGKGLVGAGILVAGTAVFARLFPNPGLDELTIYLGFLVAVASLIWINKWLVAN